MKVMLIDEAKAVRERLGGVLSDLPGIEVMIQASGTETLLPVIQRKRPDVVILDINMTGGGGLDLIRGIREKGESPLVIVLSSSSNLQYRRKCLEAGAMYFFDKVWEQDWLFDTVLALKEELG